jgi:hypothetical protein
MNILRQFQTASTIKAVISEVTSDGNAIFTTAQGKFMLSAPSLNLKQGDRLELVVSANQSKLQAVITTTNNTPINLTPVELMIIPESSPLDHRTSVFETEVIKGGMPTNKSINNVTGETRYLNLSQINPKSALYQSISGLQKNDIVEFKVVNSSDIKLPLPPGQILAEVATNEGTTKQLLKTNFGVFVIDKTNFPEGKQIVVKIATINSAPPPIPNITAKVEDALFLLNNNWPIVESLIKLIAPTNKKSSTFNFSDEEHLSQAESFSSKRTIIELLLKNENHEVLSQLSKEFDEIRDLITVSPNQNSNSLLLTAPINIKVKENDPDENPEIQIYSNGENQIRFLVDIVLEALGTIKMEGSIQFTSNHRIENFNLLVKTQNLLDQNIKNYITAIFSTNKNIAGIHGDIYFEII